MLNDANKFQHISNGLQARTLDRDRTIGSIVRIIILNDVFCKHRTMLVQLYLSAAFDTLDPNSDFSAIM